MAQPKHETSARALKAGAIVTADGRITVPADVRRSLGVGVGDRLNFHLIAPGQYVVSKAEPSEDLPIAPDDPATTLIAASTPAAEKSAHTPIRDQLQQAAALARIASMHDGLDVPEQKELRLSEHGVMERIQLAEARRSAVFDSRGKTDMTAPLMEARMRAKAVELVMGGTRWLTAADMPSHAIPLLAGWLEQGRIFALEQEGVQLFPRYAFDSIGEPVPVLKDVLNVLAGCSPFQIAAWFESTSAYLNAKRPREVLELDGAAVVMAAHRLVEGAVHG